MDKLSFLDFSSTINGIVVDASFSKESIKEIFIPLLKHLSSMCSEKQARILVMLAAPPGAGKSTLVSFLEYLAKDAVPEKAFQAIGMDGFHRKQEYLLTHTAIVDGKEIPMVNIKGAPVTFDLERLREKISELMEGHPCRWPIYDRLLHLTLCFWKATIFFWILTAGGICQIMRISPYLFQQMKNCSGNG